MNLAVFVAVFVALFVAIVIPMLALGPQWRVAEARARKRRMAQHRMNARLLRFDI